MSGRLTTHVLDLSQGLPAAGLVLQLWWLESSQRRLLLEVVTNADGRLDKPLLEGTEMETGSYELLFMAGDYFRNTQSRLGTDSTSAKDEMEVVAPFFLEQIPIRFNITNVMDHYHVPLLVAPGGYSTYRGS
ncbi:hydroxyisourate hydrolase [Paenibacillus sp. 19GGS1-52]|uniref:hydroxyisourate hydrolase n=1 Tax=Paenibacillus sp. 19GGS1-52 TaxID=2758563 RepID=UPI001EFB8F4E|nr:hydroxyisourate hydrolase [Paenibacillus sp. 19GGS1-52]ULO06318.1 hydroxyisourate hydrolase [Paenibacillus sp. 19GGS1-52]